MLTWYIQNPAIGQSSGIFRALFRIFSIFFNMQKPGILEILEYSAPFHNRIPNHIQNPVISMKIYEYSELRHILNHTHIQNPLKDLRLTFLRK